MVISCAADGCTSRWSPVGTLGFFQFPSDPGQLEAWIRGACPQRQLDWRPSQHLRICSKHFVSSKPSKDRLDVDWAPSIIDLREGSREAGERAKERPIRATKRSALDTSTRGLQPAKAACRASSPARPGSDLGTDHESPPKDHEPLSYNDLLDENRRVQKTVDDLEAECEYLRTSEERVAVLESEVIALTEHKMSVESIRNDDSKTRFYTGLPKFTVFLALFEYLEQKAGRMRLWRGPAAEEARVTQGRGIGGRKGGRKVKLMNEFLMVLMCLRLGLFTEDVAQRFGISPAYFGKIFTTWIIFS